VASLPRINSEDWDALTWWLCETLFSQASLSTEHNERGEGVSLQTLKATVHKRDVDRLKKRLHELTLLELIRVQDDAHGQKRYVFDKVQLNRYAHRADVQPVAERLQALDALDTDD
jgi:hypothetical protein